MSLLLVFGFAADTAFAQCDRTSSSPIRCGFYDEGYQDGVMDARNNQNSDFRRYRQKFSNQYEIFYRDGYNAGYDSIGPTFRWSTSQRNAYDSGYTIGQNDRRRSSQPSSEHSIQRGYDQNIAMYFQQGYQDGFSNRSRTYDVPVSNTPNSPPTGGINSTGIVEWSGRVDDRANIVIRGNSVIAENLSGNTTQTYSQNISSPLPQRPASVTAQKLDGRGDVTVIQQPSRSNNFTAIVQIYDPRGGADNYKINVSWVTAAIVEEPYRSGSVSWRGRVDQTVNIIITGREVQTIDMSASGLTNVNFNMNGYLAIRPGTVNIRKREGRGSVTVIQQPSRANDYVAIVQIFDPGGGADNYAVDITW